MRHLPLLLLAACTAAAPTGDADTDVSGAHPFGARLITLEDIDGPEACEYDEAECPTSCDGTVPPVLGEPVVVVDGWVGVHDIAMGAHVQLAFPFEDADDDLRCGSEYHSFTDPQNQTQGDGAGSLCSNFPASDDAAGGWIGWSWDITDAGTITGSFRLEDACGLSSDRWTWSAEVPTAPGATLPVPVREDALQWNDRDTEP